MLSTIILILFVMLAALLIGKILMHYFPNSGIRFGTDDRPET